MDSTYIDPYIGLADTYIMGSLVWGVFNEWEAWKNAWGLLHMARKLDSLNEQIEAQL
ncbi:MAG: hypothetical protein JSV59_08200 [Flavobacteriaceae bacterium]|nr:MAG: hypothetical protein JSV59_08200 [Flavobacteriaceae bacterium]